ncbi:MAG: DUF4870 domain-containing protein [Candidatus Methanoperedens sp.]|nr:DUF4870 domain-containing protein [Candidatus Methanoperedens sp.]
MMPKTISIVSSNLTRGNGVTIYLKVAGEITMGNNKTALGIDENIEGVLCYVLGFITGIVFMVLEKENKFVRFHAMQSIATFLPLFVIGYVIGFIPLIGWVIGPLFGLLTLVLWLLLMFKAYKGELYKLPIAGDFAEKQIG